MAAAGNANFGYFAGGIHPSAVSVARIDYSNDTASAEAKGPFSSARYGLGATGTASFCYFGAGSVPSSTGKRFTLRHKVAASNIKETASEYDIFMNMPRQDILDLASPPFAPRTGN